MENIKQRPAAVYIRSSKDRHDVSPDAQRRQLLNLAAERGLLVVQEYCDVVESAKSEHRPAFQQMIMDLRRAGRAWKVLLILDHSRLSRQPYVGHVFRYECAKQGVEVVFGNLPDLDPISKIIMDSVMDAFAVVHSIISKEKGLAGMAENVRQGFRAGGRAPRGYRLVHTPTGAVREGVAVTKSKLEPGDDVALITRYLLGRAAGTPRRKLRRDLAIIWPETTLIGMEWNALTYAGHTVWNVHNERVSGQGYANKGKRKPRAEWHIQRDTHPALIADADAEIILARVENSEVGKAIARAKSCGSDYLLTGMLVTDDDAAWIGNGKRHYRLKAADGKAGRCVVKEDIDKAVVGKMIDDMRSREFIAALLQEARKAQGKEDPTKTLRAEIAALNRQVSKAMDLAMSLDDPAPALRKVNDLEAQRRTLADEMERLEREFAAQQALQAITEDQVAELINGLAEALETAEAGRLKDVLHALIERVTLDPRTLDCRIHYRIAVSDRLLVASPRRRAEWPVLRHIEQVLIRSAG